MPEMPEVETVKEALKKKLINKKITKVDIFYNNIIEYPNIDLFKKKIKKETIIDITRRGKWLIFHLNDFYLLSHLRMEGKYFFKTKEDLISSHEHIIFTLDNKEELRYHDTRKFGRMYLLEKEKLLTQKPLINLGLEPFDINLTKSYLKNKLNNKTKPIKTSLLDQTIIAGIGNIYVDEILFLSKISPIRKSNNLSDKELDNIIKNTKKILSNAIKAGGTTIRSYMSSDKLTGNYQYQLLIHTKEHQPCPYCKKPITKIQVGGRGTYYCNNCQK